MTSESAIVTILFALSYLKMSTGQEIIEHPITQYAIEGNTVVFHCNTIAEDAYWRINNKSVSKTREENKRIYEMQGFTFLVNDSFGFYNLTIEVIASALNNNSLIVCRAASNQYENRIESKRSYLYVFRSYPRGNFQAGALNHSVFFYSNGTPIITLDIQLPSDLWPNMNINYILIIEDVESEAVIEIGTFAHVGSGIVSHTISHGIERESNYSVRVEINSIAGVSMSSTYYFDTKLDLSQYYFESCESNRGTVSSVLPYKVGIGITISLALLLLIVSIISLTCFFVCHKRRTEDKNLNTKSANNVCNTMVTNPIYDGPVYESIHRQFDSLTSTTLRAAQISDSDNSLNHCCNSQASTSSEKSDRYVDPPVQPPKPRSKSFVSNDPAHSSTSACAAAIVPRSTSISIPTVIKKTGKQRNKFNLTLTLNENAGPSDPVATQTNKMHICGLISAVNPAVVRNEEDNYTIMSPVDRGGKWNELSPEDTDKYKE